MTTLSVDGDYPGGNIVVDRLDGCTAHVHQDLRDTRGWWFYWNLRLRGAAGRDVTFRFTPIRGYESPGAPVGVRGPAYSLDDSGPWGWLEAPVSDSSFSLRVPSEAREVRLAFCIPYVQKHLDLFLAHSAGCQRLARTRLCTSRKGRSVEALCTASPARPRWALFLTARHHACESPSCYCLEGMLEAIAGASPHADWYSENTQVFAVPFMDKDGVEEGDQGKNRAPHDHWLDYGRRSIYPEVRALREQAARAGRDARLVFLDLHCPYIRDTEIQLVGGPSDRPWRQAELFGETLAASQTGPLIYAARANLPWGSGWNRSGQGLETSHLAWASSLPETLLATAVELPYATVGDAPVTPRSARAFGRDLACALRTFLEQRT